MARICLEPLWHPSNLGEHLHFEDRDEVGWLGPSSLTPHDEEKRKRRSGRSEWNGAATNLAHPSFPPSLLPSHTHSAPAFLIAFLASSLPLHRTIRRGGGRGLRRLGTPTLLEKKGWLTPLTEERSTFFSRSRQPTIVENHEQTSYELGAICRCGEATSFFCVGR